MPDRTCPTRAKRDATLARQCAEQREVIRELVEAINDMGEGECEIDRLYNTIARAEAVLNETKPTDGRAE